MSSSDYPGVTLAGAIAAELGLAGSRPERLVTAAHKYYSRIAQRAVAPEVVVDRDDRCKIESPLVQAFQRSVGRPVFHSPPSP